MPDVATTARDVLLGAIVLPLLVQWWSTYYPDAEPGGGGWVVQRMLAAKDELSTEMVEHFFRSLAESLGAALHIEVRGENTHHMIEVTLSNWPTDPCERALLSMPVQPV